MLKKHNKSTNFDLEGAAHVDFSLDLLSNSQKNRVKVPKLKTTLLAKAFPHQQALSAMIFFAIFVYLLIIKSDAIKTGWSHVFMFLFPFQTLLSCIVSLASLLTNTNRRNNKFIRMLKIYHLTSFCVLLMCNTVFASLLVTITPLPADLVSHHIKQVLPLTSVYLLIHCSVILHLISTISLHLMTSQ